MKRFICIILLLVMMLSLFSCARKTKPPFVIKHESVSAIDFKRSVFSETDSSRSCLQKSVTDKADVEDIICWVESLDLEKHDAIEIPIENVDYVIVLKGIKDHRLIFMDEYVVFDSAAFVYKDKKQMTEVNEKYNLLNYGETETTLGLIV